MLYAASAVVLILPIIAAGIYDHMAWDLKNGLIQSRHEPKLRFNVKGGRQEMLRSGGEIILWGCQLQRNEEFVFNGTQIRLAASTDMCLVAAPAKGGSRALVTGICGPGRSGKLAANEEFVIDNATGSLKLKHDNSLCIGLDPDAALNGGGLSMRPCSGASIQAESVQFVIDGTAISLRSQPELHVAVREDPDWLGAFGYPGSDVVLQKCQPAKHELFELTADGRVSIGGTRGKAYHCLNAKGGLRAGHSLISWPCGKIPADNELWTYDQSSGVISSTQDTTLVLSTYGGALNAIDGIILWKLDPHERAGRKIEM